MLLAEHEPSKIRWRLGDCYHAAIDAHMPETSQLANAIKTWWPAVLLALLEQVRNAQTEGFNQSIKTNQRVRCGYRNMDNYQSRILNRVAGNPTAETSSMNTTSLKLEEPCR